MLLGVSDNIRRAWVKSQKLSFDPRTNEFHVLWKRERLERDDLSIEEALALLHWVSEQRMCEVSIEMTRKSFYGVPLNYRLMMKSIKSDFHKEYLISGIQDETWESERVLNLHVAIMSALNDLLEYDSKLGLIEWILVPA